MVTLQKLTEALRRRGLGDSLSTISAVLKVPESTLRGWLRCAEQLGLDYSKARLLNDAEFKALRRKRLTRTSFSPTGRRFYLRLNGREAPYKPSTRSTAIRTWGNRI